jgi:hypothetical protein
MAPLFHYGLSHIFIADQALSHLLAELMQQWQGAWQIDRASKQHG